MEDPTPMPPLPQKRPFEEETEPPTVSTPIKQIRSEASTPLSVLSVRTPSPMKSRTTVSIASQDNNTNGGQSPQVGPALSTTQQVKRRKLTQQEKEDQRLEKEAKAKARAEKKAQKEAEEKSKADEKRKRDEEKRKKDEERDEKKRLKEEEQRQKEEEKLKKERSQMRLNAFFAKPKATASSGGQALVDLSQSCKAPPVPLPSTAAGGAEPLSASPQKAIPKNDKSDYERYFLPFNLPAHTILAPAHTFHENPESLIAAQGRLDALIAQSASSIPFTRNDIKAVFPARQRRNLKSPTVAQIAERHNAPSDKIVDLTSDGRTNIHDSLDMLKDISMKYLHFAEDVRPPYYGTYTKTYTVVEAGRLARNPLGRIRQDTDYDYDSEAEWEEPEEGEDLNSDGEDDADDDAEDEMDDFLDDEEDPQLKRRMISGDLVPVSTGLCWEDTDHVSKLNDGSDAICTDFKGFTMGFLLEPQPHSIDPFSTAYWDPEPVGPSTASLTAKGPTSSGPMQPQRAPLAQRSMNGLLNTLNAPKGSSSGTASKATKAKRMVPDDQLPAFKAEIQGKDLTKIGMIEALKKAFPKFPKDAIANTLSVVAARVGPTEKEKRWVLINS